jgi:hypothetical protein
LYHGRFLVGSGLLLLREEARLMQGVPIVGLTFSALVIGLAFLALGLSLGLLLFLRMFQSDERSRHIAPYIEFHSYRHLRACGNS